MSKPSASLEKILQTLEKSSISDVNIVSEIEQSFLDYSMSVITSRALPYIEDGLKPVHRRIIFAAHQEDLYNNKKFKKSAALVGAVMGSYHPHGDTSIYEALARLSQDFNMRYPLIEGQGNFGSIDGDSPAAMRYTEVKLSKLGEYFLDGIKEDAVDFTPNYDGSKVEPKILPTILPHILLNGCSGIAVGLATNIPPHNLGELCDAVLALIDNPEIKIEELFEYIQGPDFPTGGLLLNYEGVTNYFRTGSGTFVLRSKVQIVEETHKNLIIVNEIPYGVKKSNIIRKIISLIKPSKYEVGIPILEYNITNIKDESNLDGIRLIIECKKETEPEVILNNLYKYTPLQKIFAANVTVLVDSEPKVLNLLEILKIYLKHQIVMLIRRTKFNLKNVLDRIHILEGRKIVALNILEVVAIISDSETPEEDMKKLYGLSNIQIKDIFSLPLRSIKKIEQIKLIEELNKEIATKLDLEETLKDEKKQFTIIKNKITDIRDKFADARRTEITGSDLGGFLNEDLISSQKVVITLSEKGYISQIPLKTFKVHKRGGVGVKGSEIYKDDNVKMLITCYSLDNLLLFTSLGKVYRLKAYNLDLKDRTDKAQSISAALDRMEKGEKIITIISATNEEFDDENTYLLFVSKKGIVKKVSIQQFKSIRCVGKIACGIREGDSPSFVIKTKDTSFILIASSKGKVIKFPCSSIRPLSRVAAGVVGIRIKGDDYVVSASSSLQGNKVFSIGTKGIGKITDLDKFRETKRAGTGIFAQKITAKTGSLLACTIVNENHEVLLMSNKNKINRFKISDVSEYGRVSAGVTLFKLESQEKVVYFALNENTPDNDEGAPNGNETVPLNLNDVDEDYDASLEVANDFEDQDL